MSATIALTDAEIAALRAILARCEAPSAPSAPSAPTGMAWGAKVSAEFRARVQWIAGELSISADNLMACMAWETGRKFSSSVRNMAGSGATGLIQFMPDTLFLMNRGRAVYDATPKNERIRVGKIYCDELAQMTAEDQLNWVYKYFAPFKGRIHNLADTYMAILLPSAVGQPDDHALFTGGVAYRQNAGLDANKDGKVTKAECAAKLYAMRAEGLRPENVA